MKSVLSIIVTYNFEPWLDKCLSSLLHSSYPTDIIVIDNASKDNTVGLIRQNYPQVILLENKINLGFGKANNLGFEYALNRGYDFVFLVNQDAWIHPDCLTHLMTKSYPKEIGVISPLHYDGTEQVFDKGFADYVKQLDLNLDNIICSFVNAAFWLIPITIIKQIGGFSPLFYHYGEDSDYAHRLHYHGYNIAINRHAIAYHDRQNRIIDKAGESFFKSEFTYFLTEYANINYSFQKAFRYAVLGAIKKALLAIPKDWQASTAYFGVALRLVEKTGLVRNARRENKKLYTSYWRTEKSARN
ncbi:glycosyltransferase family 2 protein [Sphingobacterium sp. SGR-19]|uniref:glycosyltransferase family 2 protein n=1 Tax=Sphingobacterium sp. SGR-19 TaxID=2710886 RepID=UPI0013ECA1B2|nr:glycosyltransferase family 2 protein [Sphingobacterium sp. SGR-19]NGM65747.1 glycosyltransferase family 2 protein [Sphingobacterium sp. SGR-19]